VSAGQLHGYAPFLLFDGCELGGGACANKKPIFFEPGIVFLGGAGNPPILGIAFGTGNRAELARPNTETQAFFYIVDSGLTSSTLRKSNLQDLSPSAGGAPCPLPYTVACANAVNGFVLTTDAERKRRPRSDAGLPVADHVHAGLRLSCATNGSSYRYASSSDRPGYYGTAGGYAYESRWPVRRRRHSRSAAGGYNRHGALLRGAIRQTTPGTVHDRAELEGIAGDARQASPPPRLGSGGVPWQGKPWS
jgi:hypothetical protein